LIVNFTFPLGDNFALAKRMIDTKAKMKTRKTTILMITVVAMSFS